VEAAGEAAQLHEVVEAGMAEEAAAEPGTEEEAAAEEEAAEAEELVDRPAQSASADPT
tara:strand:+ start:239 stop:412 length:174 start_codon:yes stop_codon:yes gene_type:complete